MSTLSLRKPTREDRPLRLGRATRAFAPIIAMLSLAVTPACLGPETSPAALSPPRESVERQIGTAFLSAAGCETRLEVFRFVVPGRLDTSRETNSPVRGIGIFETTRNPPAPERDPTNRWRAAVEHVELADDGHTLLVSLSARGKGFKVGGGGVLAFKLEEGCADAAGASIGIRITAWTFDPEKPH